jgi:hypothetical protein
MPTIGRRTVIPALALTGLLCGCASTSPTAPEAAAPGSRPMVRASAAENTVSSSTQSQLNFFDDLEIRPIAAQDDALHAALLLGTGKSGENYEHRVLLAKRLGYIPSSFNRPGRQAVTVGEVAAILSAIAEPKTRRTQEQSIAWLVESGILTQRLPAFQGLTGAQLVSLVGGVQDLMLASGVTRADLPALPVPATTITSRSGATRQVEPLPDLNKPDPTKPELVKSDPAKPAAGAARAAPKGRAEPLPALPKGEKAPAVDLDPGALKPAAVGPDGKIVPARPPTPTPPPSPPPAKPAD